MKDLKKRSNKVYPYRVYAICGKCNEGDLISLGTGFSNTWGTFWNHQCNKCGYLEEIEDDQYPKIEYSEEISE